MSFHVRPAPVQRMPGPGRWFRERGPKQKSGATVGTTAAPCVLSPAFGGKGMGADDSTLNSVLNASFPVVLRKDLEIYTFDCSGP
jgi:hypothetical protein